MVDTISSPSPSVELECDPSGQLTGRFFETTSVSILELTHFSRALRYSKADRLSALRISQQAALATATTTIFEGHGVEPAVFRAYEALHREGHMAIRAELVFSPDWANATREPATLVAQDYAWLAGAGRGDDVLRMRGIFINPHVTHDDRIRSKCGYSGIAGYHFGSGLPDDIVLDVLKAVARAQIRAVGLTPTLFSLFDRAAEDVDIQPLRWIIQHCGHLPKPHAEIALRRNLGLSFLPVEAVYKQAAQLRGDPSCTADIMPLRRLLDANLTVSIASDNIPPSLFFAIWCCLARRDYLGRDLPDPDGPISRIEALRIATSGAARCLGRDDTLGSLTPGKYADLAILDRDYFDCPLDDVPNITAHATMVGGQWRHGDPAGLPHARGPQVNVC